MRDTDSGSIYIAVVDNLCVTVAWVYDIAKTGILLPCCQNPVEGLQ
jgi:hypothetical protein